jgi:hypothetical protein
VRVYGSDAESVYSLWATYLSEGSVGDGGFGGLGDWGIEVDIFVYPALL